MLPSNFKPIVCSHRWIPLAIAMVLLGPGARAETWTNLQGTSTIEAKMIGLWEESVILQLSDGRRRTIKLEQLRGDSRIQARNIAKQQAAARDERIKQLKQDASGMTAAAPSPLPLPPPAAPYSPPQKDASIGDFVKQVNDALTAGHLRVLYDFRPPSYRQDIRDLIQLAASKTSPETFDTMTSVPFRLGDVIVTRQNWLFAGPRFANVPAQQREKAKWTLLGLANVLQQGIGPTAIQLATFQNGEFESWLESWDNKTSPYVAEMIQKSELDLAGNTSVVSEAEGTATISTGSGSSKSDVEMVLVEGFWVRKSTADTWAADAEQAKTKINDTADGQYLADQAVMAKLLGAMLDSIAKTDSADQFNQSFDTVLSHPDAANRFSESLGAMLSPIQTILMGASDTTDPESSIGDDK